MPDGLVVYRFGAFEFDPESRSLSRADARLTLPAPQAAILARLLSHSGAVVPKDKLIDAGWPGLAVAENSLSQAIHRLRKVLGTDTTYIETVPFHKFRFAAPVERAVREVTPASIEARLGPFLTCIEARAKLETLDRDGIRKVRAELAIVLLDAPNHARMHVLLAMACGLAYEASATDDRRDTAAPHEGIAHARRGCDLAPSSGEAWSTLAFLLGLSRCSDAAAAAAASSVAEH